MLQVKASHVTEVDYNRAAANEWINPAAVAAQVGAAAAGLQLTPGLAPGLSGVPSAMPMPSFLPGLPGSAPLTVPGLTGGIPGLGAAGIPGLTLTGAFPPPP